MTYREKGEMLNTGFWLFRKLKQHNFDSALKKRKKSKCFSFIENVTVNWVLISQEGKHKFTEIGGCRKGLTCWCFAIFRERCPLEFLHTSISPLALNNCERKYKVKPICIIWYSIVLYFFPFINCACVRI